MADEETRDRLSGVLTAPLLALGLDLEAIEVTPAGKRRLLRVAVDKDGGVSLDEIAAATKQVSQLLDETDVMGDKPYLLEVSSPGIDRPLTLPRHLDVNGKTRSIAYADVTKARVQVEFNRKEAVA